MFLQKNVVGSFHETVEPGSCFADMFSVHFNDISSSGRLLMRISSPLSTYSTIYRFRVGNSHIHIVSTAQRDLYSCSTLFCPQSCLTAFLSDAKERYHARMVHLFRVLNYVHRSS